MKIIAGIHVLAKLSILFVATISLSAKAADLYDIGTLEISGLVSDFTPEEAIDAIVEYYSIDNVDDVEISYTDELFEITGHKNVIWRLRYRSSADSITVGFAYELDEKGNIMLSVDTIDKHIMTNSQQELEDSQRAELENAIDQYGPATIVESEGNTNWSYSWCTALNDSGTRCLGSVPALKINYGETSVDFGK